jgi:hypothetical protein
MDITVYKNFDGHLTLSAIHNGYLVTRQYFFMSTRAATADFKQYLRGA